MEDLSKNIAAAIRQTQEKIKQHLPAIEASVNGIIQSKSTDAKAIEHTLDTLLDLQYIGLGRELFIRLLEYYKTRGRRGFDNPSSRKGLLSISNAFIYNKLLPTFCQCPNSSDLTALICW